MTSCSCLSDAHVASRCRCDGGVQVGLRPYADRGDMREERTVDYIFYYTTTPHRTAPRGMGCPTWCLYLSDAGWCLPSVVAKSGRFRSPTSPAGWRRGSRMNRLSSASPNRMYGHFNNHFRTISHASLSYVPLYTRRVVCSTSCPGLSDPDLVLGTRCCVQNWGDDSSFRPSTSGSMGSSTRRTRRGARGRRHSLTRWRSSMPTLASTTKRRWRGARSITSRAR